MVEPDRQRWQYLPRRKDAIFTRDN